MDDGDTKGEAFGENIISLKTLPVALPVLNKDITIPNTTFSMKWKDIV